jgi:hypothetical protein
MILRAFLLSRWGLCMFLLLEVRVGISVLG